MGSLRDVLVPDIGDFKNIAVIEVLVKPGDTVKAEDSLITLESDKATMEVPAPFAGVVRELKIKPGDKVSQGAAILSLEISEGAAVPAPAAVAAQKPASATPAPASAPAVQTPAPAAMSAPSPQPVAPAAINEEGFSRAHASPSVRRFARELGVDLGRVKGSGPKQRLLKEDIAGFVVLGDVRNRYPVAVQERAGNFLDARQRQVFHRAELRKIHLRPRRQSERQTSAAAASPGGLRQRGFDKAGDIFLEEALFRSTTLDASEIDA